MSRLPIPRAVLVQHVAILGKTRSGKSSVMRLLVEDLLERKLPVCIVDPKGDWYGIKLAADGKSAGYPVVIFGGEHADIPINETNGAEVAELFATGNRPCLIDLGGWMVAPRTRFWIAFASTLFKLTKGERWLAVDEFHNFAPKGSLKGLDGEMAKALHWSNRLASEGLGKGLALLFASQRPQKVHNDVLTSAETLIAMRVLHPSDRSAVSDWIKGCGDSDGSQVINTLANMDRGEGWAWSPEIGFGPKRVKFPMFQTYDSFRAQTVQDAKRLTGWADVNIEDVKAKFAATIERAKAEDPKELRRQLADRDRELRELRKVNAVHAGVQASAKSIEKRVEVPVLKEGQLARFEKVMGGLPDRLATAIAPAMAMPERVTAAVAPVVTVCREIVAALGKLNGNGRAPAPLPVSRPLPLRPLPISRAENRKSPSGDTDTSLPKGERAILTAAAQHDGAGRKQLTVLTAYKRSTRDAYIQRLTEKGFVSVQGDRVLPTDTGVAALGPDFELLPVGDALREHWMARLPEGERRCLDVVAASYPEAVDRERISEVTGYKRSTRDAYLQRLGSRRLVSDAGRGQVQASEELFG